MWKRVPWVNLWMMAFGGVGIWIIADTFFSMDSIYTFGRTVMTALVILGMVGLVGFVRLPLSFFYETGEPKMINLNDLAGIYLKAWKGLWRRKWIVLLFGLAAALNLTGGLTEAVLTKHYLAAKAGEIWHTNTTPFQNLPMVLPGSLPRIIVDTLSWFFPRTGLGSGTGVIVMIAVALLLVLPWLYSRLGRLRSDEEYARGARFVQLALVSCGIIALAVLVVVPPGFILSLQGLAAGTIPSSPIQAFTIAASVWMLAQTLLNAFIISGVIGSLKREDGRVTIDSFLKASVLHFRPVAGLLFLMALVSFAFEAAHIATWFSSKTYLPTDALMTLETPLTVITLLLMLVPFAMVVKNLPMWQGVKRGIREWVLNVGQVVSFIMLGVTFLVPILLVTTATGLLVPQVFAAITALAPVNVAIDMLLIALMLLAVWEFHQLISKGETVGESEA